MKKDIHPDFVDCQVVCACGNKFTTKSTTEKIETELCSKCHPFFTGEQILVDTAGQVDRFQKRQQVAQQRQDDEAKKQAAKKPDTKPAKKVDEMSRDELLQKIKHDLEEDKKAKKAKKSTSKSKAAATDTKKKPSKKKTSKADK